MGDNNSKTMLATNIQSIAILLLLLLVLPYRECHASLDDYFPPSSDSSPTSFTKYQEKLYFRASDSYSGNELWVYDGNDSTRMVTTDENEINACSGSFPRTLIIFQNRLIFQASNLVTKFYSYDGSTNTVREVEAIPSAGFRDGQGANSVAVYNNKLYIDASAGNGMELWAYDGGSASLVVSIGNRQEGLPNDAFLTEYHDKLYFSANDGIHGYEL